MAITITRDMIPRHIAEQSGVNVTKVLGWIKSGELPAYNVSNSKRPRYRITPEAYEAFKAARAAGNLPSQKRRKEYV